MGRRENERNIDKNCDDCNKRSRQQQTVRPRYVKITNSKRQARATNADIDASDTGALLFVLDFKSVVNMLVSSGLQGRNVILLVLFQLAKVQTSSAPNHLWFSLH